MAPEPETASLPPPLLPAAAKAPKPKAIPVVDTPSAGGLLGQSGLPFIIKHDLADRIWGAVGIEDGSLAGPNFSGDWRSWMQRSNLAAAASWYALLSPDGVVGQYNRDHWGVSVSINSSDAATHVQDQDQEASQSPREVCKSTVLQWVPLKGQSHEASKTSSAPRHITTKDMSAEAAFELWSGGVWRDSYSRTCEGGTTLEGAGSPTFRSAPEAGAGCRSSSPCGDDRPRWKFSNIYLRGALPPPLAARYLEGTVFSALLETAAFGMKPFLMSLYASSAGMQTNLHVDEHSGFLVQFQGTKRVVLFPKTKAARQLRCEAWGDAEAPISRRSWHDDGMPDGNEWQEMSPFAGLGGVSVELHAGEALFIPKGCFHDVLSRGEETFGMVLRCHDTRPTA